MPFPYPEIQFYTTCFVVASLAGLARLWRDDERVGLRGGIGRCFSCGVLSFGIVGVWAGRNPGSINGSGFYFLAIAALIGWMSRDLQDKILARIVDQIMARISKWFAYKPGPGDDNSPK